ncbi:MAG: RnfABCDGE type electron transport complex subunit D [Treponema sp.]|nr:RnfABCDGE type electron transport complex subunit D [Treponema sp.]MBQ4235294.1 RnfABCDGE type electron transport complex subunit D [Treponema sp.]
MTDPKTNTKDIYLSSSPHFCLGFSTRTIMLAVLISLLPECIYGVIVFGLGALMTILVSVVSCVLFEFLFQKITRKKVCIDNLSAAVTGVLLALVLPSTVPLWMVVIGAFVAVVIAKGLFGGIGSNVFNPALTGRAFMFMSFAAALGATWFNPASDVDKWTWNIAQNVDAVSSATMMSQVKSGVAFFDSDTLLTYFFGNRAGCIGETSILLILISFAFLALSRIIDWRASVSMVGTVAVLTFFSSLIEGHGLGGSGFDVLTALCTGGLMFGAVFMITDYATSPVTKKGRLIFGAGAGLITFLIRKFGGYPEGVMFSILIMNAVAPFLNNLTARKYGYGKKGHARADVRKIAEEYGLEVPASAEEEK